MKRSLKILAGAALALAGVAAPASTPHNWDDQASATADGMPVLGNQAAPVRLIEFISYTCPHCATYATESDQPLSTGLVRQGQVAVEMRPYFRNGIDVVATLLALCGPDEKFFANHQAILAAQESWLRAPLNPNAQQRWANPVFGERLKAVAEDLGLYRIMLNRGYTPVELDQCLADETLAKSHEVATQYAYEKLGVQGTPSFMINGQLQTVHSWPELEQALNAAVAARKTPVEKR